VKVFRIYLFDLEGNLIRDFDSAKLAAIELSSTENTINSAIHRKSCVKQSYYLSRSPVFEVPIRKTNFNPLLYGHALNKNKLINEY